MFKETLQNTPYGMVIVDAAGFIVFTNPSAAALFQKDQEALIGRAISDLLPEISFNSDGASFEPLKIGSFENLACLPSDEGAPRYCEVRLSQTTNTTDRELSVVNLNEVTDHVRSWLALKDREERWNTALEGSQIGVFESNLRTGSGCASDVWYHLLGVENFAGKDSDHVWQKRIHPDDRAKVEALDAECIAGRVERSEAKFRMRVGNNWRWMRSILRVTERDFYGDPVRVLGTMIDITPLERALELAEARKRGLEMLVSNAPVAMAVLTLDGTFMLSNDLCYPLFGYSQEELEQRKVWQLAGATSLDNLRGEVQRLLAGNTNISRVEERYVRPNGDVIDIAIRISIYRREKIEDSRLIVQMVDITETKRLDALKNDFVATVSHELRTPLASIHGALRLISSIIDHGPSDQVKKLLGLADRNSERLTQVVNDLLDFQKMTAGHFSVDIAPVDAIDIVQQTIADNQPFADKFGVTVSLDTQQPVVIVNGDPTRLKQVITNLLSNAAKFSSRCAAVTVRADVDNSGCIISVTNGGRGISPEYGTRLFEPFSQQAEHLTRDREGTGLGLAICKELVENMGGEIGYLSTPNVETTFWVRLPLAGGSAVSEPLRLACESSHAIN